MVTLSVRHACICRLIAFKTPQRVTKNYESEKLQISNKDWALKIYQKKQTSLFVTVSTYDQLVKYALGKPKYCSLCTNNTLAV